MSTSPHLPQLHAPTTCTAHASRPLGVSAIACRWSGRGRGRDGAGGRRGLAREVGYLAGSLLVAIYLGRLLIVTATDPLVAGPAIFTGFLVAPAWYLWLGVALRRAGALP